MQRIDENTYIDDTLVTYAEYQLFIDEMREQGKYYQPDHWTSYQFPEGQAREPILGVRRSDAVAFCEWLTGHEKNVWKFRLPTENQAGTAPLKIIETIPLGYWVIRSNNITHDYWNDLDGEFRWVSTIPKDHHTPDLDLNLNLDLIQGFTIFYEQSMEIFQVHMNDETLRYFNDIEAPIEIVRNLDLDVVAARNLNLSLQNTPANILKLTNILQEIYHLIPDNSSPHELELLDEIEYFEKNFFDLYLDLFTLQERIAGRSPAFEGIRLVKERIR